MDRLQAVLWFGGKGMMLSKLLPILEGIPHRYYCEPFGGGGSVLLNKRPVLVETYNDIDAGLHNFFMVLSDPELFAGFKRRVEALPYSRRLYYGARDSWGLEADPVKRAALWYVVARQSFGGKFGVSWGFADTATTWGAAITCSRWRMGVAGLDAIHERLMRVQIECLDWRFVFRNLDGPDTLFYIDPPYIGDDRRWKKYDHELSVDDHVELVEILLGIEGSAALSGYPNKVYWPLEEAGWHRYEWRTVCFASPRTRSAGLQGAGSLRRMQARTECLWVKPYESGLLF